MKSHNRIFYIIIILMSLVLFQCGEINPVNTVDDKEGSGTSPLPEPDESPMPYKLIEAGSINAFVIKQDGTLWGWGGNFSYSLGIGTSGSIEQPVQIGTDKDWKIIRSGYDTTAAIKEDGSLWFWGSREKYTGENYTAQPVEFLPGTKWLDVSLGFNHILAIKSDHTLWSWGHNYYGQLGTNNRASDFTEIQEVSQVLLTGAFQNLGEDDNWIKIFSDYNISFAIDGKGRLWSWGSNQNHQLGYDWDDSIITTPVYVGVDTDWSSLWPGDSVLALKTDKSLWAWGEPNGSVLGIGNSDYYADPVKIGDLSQFSTLDYSYGVVLGIKNDNSLWGWGGEEDSSELLGQGPLSEPTRISEDNDWLSLYFEGSYVLAVKTDGSLWSWGGDYQGQLGDGPDEYPPCSGECTVLAYKSYPSRVLLP